MSSTRPSKQIVLYSQEQMTQTVRKRAFKCKQCCRRFATVRTLRDHRVIHEENFILTCYQCKETFKENADLVQHKQTDHGRDDTHTCETCSLDFTGHSTYLVHLVDHLEVKPFKCFECPKLYRNKRAISEHISSHFEIIEAVSCPSCKMKLKNESNLKVHMSKFCNNTESVCGECGKLFPKKQLLQYHMVSHTGVRPHQCLYCGKGFMNTKQLTVHTRSHNNERPYQCDVCHKTFKQQTYYKHHTLAHLAADERPSFTCEVCQKKFRHKTYLSFHMRTHTNYRPYGCDHCGGSFTNKASVKSHIIHHHNESRPYPCRGCRMTFKTNSTLKRHARVVHDTKV